MVARSWFSWLVWLVLCLGQASPRSTVCDLDPCQCTRGQLVCDCTGSTVQKIVLRDEQYPVSSFSSISVGGCSHVHVGSEAFSGLPALQQVSIGHVTRLTLDERCFHWTTDQAAPNHRGLLVNISHALVPELPSYSLKGSLREVLFTSVKILRVRAYAFGSIDLADKIEFTKVTFNEIETQSFKKLGVNFLIFRESSFNVMPERAVMDIDVHQEVKLDTVKIGRIKTNAFRVNEPKNFKIVQSVINNVESKAFHVHTKGDVSIRDNVFGSLEEGAFLGFTVERKYFLEAGKEDIVFENNSIANFEENALSFNTSCLKPRLDRVMIKQPCSCSEVDSWLSDLVAFSTDPKQPQRLDLTIYCMNPSPTTIKDYLTLNCILTKSSLYFKMVVGAAVALVLLAVVVLLYCRFVSKKGKRYINVPTGASAAKPAESHKPHMLVVPEGKTYRETELHVIVDHAEPIVHLDYVKDTR